MGQGEESRLQKRIIKSVGMRLRSHVLCTAMIVQ